MAQPQTYANHRKFVPLFHYVVLPILMVNIGLALWGVVQGPGLPSLWVLAMAIALFLGALFARVFALQAQDRVIRLEERLRMREILPADLQARIPEISREQIIGLRFASDEELPALTARVLGENIQKREEVKKLVRHWRADDHQL
ncbi:MAG: DUF6526 family protein [Vicinamibacterales bacterium]